VLQTIRYLLDRPLCFRLERQLAGSDFHRRINRAFQGTHNNRAEETIRTPVCGRKNYYGSGSIWSAQLAAMLFSIFQTLALWGMNPRAWLSAYLNACAEGGAQAPSDLEPFLPWSMDAARRAELCRPKALVAPAESPPGIDSS
jgi:hypothetical protein